MNELTNRVEKAIIKLEYPEKNQARRGNRIIESIYPTHIYPLLDQIFREYIPEDIHLEIPKIEIDLGRIPSESLAKGLTGKLKVQVEHQIALALNQAGIRKRQTTSNNSADRSSYLLHALSLYMNKGILPLWIPANTEIGALLEQAIVKIPQDLKEMLFKELRNSNSRDRLLAAITPHVYNQLIALFLKSNAEELISFRDKLLIEIPKILALGVSTRRLQSIVDSSLMDYAVLYYRPNKLMRSMYEFGLNALQKELQLDDIQLGVIGQEFKHLPAIDTNRLKSGATMINEPVKNQFFVPDDIVSALNNGESELHYPDRSQLQSFIIKRLKDKAERARFMDFLTNEGALRLLKLFDITDATRQLRRWSEFANIVQGNLQLSSVVRESWIRNNLVVFHLVFSKYSNGRVPGNEEALLFISYATQHGLPDDPHDQIYTNTLGRLNIDPKVWSQTLKKERIAGDVLRASGTLIEYTPLADLKQETLSPAAEYTEYRDLARKKLVSDFILGGKLSEMYELTTLDELRKIFEELLGNNEKSLTDLIEKNMMLPELWNRILVLCTPDSMKLLKALVIQNFKEEYEWFQGLNELQKHNFVYQFDGSILLERAGQFVSLALSDDRLATLLLGSISYSVTSEELQESKVSVQSVVRDLLNFVPESITINRAILLWRQLVLQVAHSYLSAYGQKKPEDFLTELAHRLTSKVRSGMQRETLLEIVEAMTASGNQTIIKFREYYLNPPPSARATKPMIYKGLPEIKRRVRILRFYAQHHFMPWWSAENLEQLITDLEISLKLKPELLEEEISEQFRDDRSVADLCTILPSNLAGRWKKLANRRDFLKGGLEEKRFEPNAGTGIEKVIKETDIGLWFQSAHRDEKEWSQILYYFTDEEILRSLTTVPKSVKDIIKSYTGLAPFFYFGKIGPVQWRREIYSTIKIHILGGDVSGSADLEREIIGHLSNRGANIPWRKYLGKVYQSIQNTTISPKPEYPEELYSAFVEASDKDDISNEKAVEPAKKETTYPEVKTTRVNNAGLILLAPFLSTYFDRLNMLAGGQFRDLTTQKRAVYLIQNLVFNSIDFREFQLVLNKIVSGLPMEEHLQPIEELTQEEISLSRSLLEGVLMNWEKLKNSSVEAFQETFLQREGILEFREDRLVLQVEKRGVDVLLSSIPWNYTTIKLAWMDTPIYVEWN